jgi:transposase
MIPIPFQHESGSYCPAGNGNDYAPITPRSELRAIAVGRRNWTFAGSDEGGRRAAALYTLTAATAKLNDVDPQAWLADVLARMPDYPAKRIGDLLPWNWHAERHAAA